MRTETVTQAIYEAGFNSNGRFYSTSDDMLGMTPSHYRSGGTQEELHFAVDQCSLGAILVATSAKGVAAILIGDDPEALTRDLQDQFRNARLIGGDPAFEALVARVWASSKPRISASTCLWTCAGRHSSKGYGKRCATSPRAPRQPTPTLPPGSGRPRRCAPWLAPVPPMLWPWPSRPSRHPANGALSGYRWGIERKRDLLLIRLGRSCESDWWLPISWPMEHRRHAEPDAGGARGASAAGDRPAREWADL